MENNSMKKLLIMFNNLENYKDNLFAYKKKEGFIVIPFFISENCLFVLLSIVYYFIKFLFLIYQVIIKTIL